MAIKEKRAPSAIDLKGNQLQPALTLPICNKQSSILLA
jgi:hypothetical protein